MFIVDFYCHEYKLVIEVDGEVHNHDPKGYRQIIPPLGGQGGKNPTKTESLE